MESTTFGEHLRTKAYTLWEADGGMEGCAAASPHGTASAFLPGQVTKRSLASLCLTGWVVTVRTGSRCRHLRRFVGRFLHGVMGR
jgi:hypothetical protein